MNDPVTSILQQIQQDPSINKSFKQALQVKTTDEKQQQQQQGGSQCNNQSI